jgi:hypothetical protein
MDRVGWLTQALVLAEARVAELDERYERAVTEMEAEIFALGGRTIHDGPFPEEVNADAPEDPEGYTGAVGQAD